MVFGRMNLILVFGKCTCCLGKDFCLCWGFCCATMDEFLFVITNFIGHRLFSDLWRTKDQWKFEKRSSFCVYCCTIGFDQQRFCVENIDLKIRSTTIFYQKCKNQKSINNEIVF